MKQKVFWMLIIGAVLLVLILLGSDAIIGNYSQDRLYDRVGETPKNRVGLILGTAKYLTNGGNNPYYDYRIAAAIALYEAGKIEYILASGDNGSRYYDEPTAIKKDLVKAGIPPDRITLDYAGFRTLDSMYRAKEVFGLDSVTVISQKFHNERAVFIGARKGLYSVGFNANDVSAGMGLKVRLREYLARTKVFLDLLFHVEPKFYGEPESIP